MAISDDDIRRIRALIPDKEAVFDGQTMFDDEDIEDYFVTGRGSALRAAGLACMAIGTSEALISKIIQTQDLLTNGAQAQLSYVKKAEVLFEQADAEDAKNEQPYFKIVDYGWGNYPPELTETRWF